MGGRRRIDCRASAEETDDHNATACSQNLVVVAHCGRARDSGVARRGAVGLGLLVATRDSWRSASSPRSSPFARTRSHFLAIALGAAVVRDRVRAARRARSFRRPADAATWAHAITDLVIGVLLIATVLLGLRFRRGTGGPRELLDGLTVAAGAGLTAWITLANPAIDGGMQPGLAVLATAYLPMAIMLAHVRRRTDARGAASATGRCGS